MSLFVRSQKRGVPCSRSTAPAARGAGSLRRAFILPHVRPAGDPHHHGERRLCPASAQRSSGRAFSLSFDHVPPEAGGASARSSQRRKDPSRSWRVSGGRAPFPTTSTACSRTDCCRQSFFRGAFLAGGSAFDPDKRYHLELLTSHPSVSREAFNLMLEMGFAPGRRAQRRIHHVFQAVRSH